LRSTGVHRPRPAPAWTDAVVYRTDVQPKPARNRPGRGENARLHGSLAPLAELRSDEELAEVTQVLAEATLLAAADLE